MSLNKQNVSRKKKGNVEIKATSREYQIIFHKALPLRFVFGNWTDSLVR